MINSFFAQQYVDMSATASKRLIMLAEEIEPSSLGVSIDAIGKMPVNENVRSDILSCLYDVNPSEVGWGLWFCEGLLSVGKLDAQLKEALYQQIPSLLTFDDAKIRAAVLPIAIELRKQLPDYRKWMLQSLKDPSATVRRLALLNSQTFLKAKEIEPLLVFKDDGYLTETSMGSPLVYVLRNEALERIETSIEKTFERKQLSQIVQGGETALWRDWEPFLEWWNKRQHKWHFWNLL